MDQNSSNGSGADKRNWRERLGIGGKDMPKISDEFKTAPPSELKVPQPVAKPAPMAPRATAPKIPAAPNAEALADKLRSQREAAEKLAEQRVSAVRERAEAKFVPPPAPVSEPSYLARPEPRAEQGRPKFMFADDELSAAKAEAAPSREVPPMPKPRSAAPPPPPLVPPRPALGGDRFPPQTRPPVPPGQPQYRPQAPSTYRPIDPAAAPPPFRASGSPPRSYLPGTVPPGYGDSRYGSGRPGLDTHRRGPETGYGDSGRLEGDPRSARSMPARPRQGVAADDYGDVFEDEPSRPRRRASASEYNSAYREVEDGYEDDRRRSSGPWLLLLALLIAAVATFGVIWWINIKKTAVTAIPDNVPVVAAPIQPAKTAAEQPLDSTAAAGAANKKQIYDRIVGDQEVSGERIVPAEEPPIAPESQQPAASEIPQPPAATAPEGDSEPLALPPPPGEEGTDSGNTQGSISQTPDQQTIASKITETDAVVAQPVPASDMAADALLPAPAEPAAAESAPVAPAETTTEPESPAALIKKTETKKTAEKKLTSEQAALGAEPVVLVPPTEYVPPASTTGSSQQTPSTNTQAETKKKKTLFDLLQGTGKSSSTTETAAAQPGTSGTETAAEPAQQVAALPEPAPPQQQTTSTTAASGYVVQLASFRSEAEAQTEYGRLKAKYPSIIGALPPRINRATVSGSTRYRLGLGPMASRDSASKLCSSLVAAGERDCLVRKQ